MKKLLILFITLGFISCSDKDPMCECADESLYYYQGHFIQGKYSIIVDYCDRDGEILDEIISNDFYYVRKIDCSGFYSHLE